MPSGSGFTVSRSPLLEQNDGIEVYPARDTFQAPERQVALASLQTTHVGAVHAHDLSKSLLAEPQRLTVGAQVAPDGPLQVAFHIRNARDLLLDGLQTHQ
jgi:hypothetical protein